ncbi:hypothetical protein [Saccharomonospora saliphila]|uniref:hypothetical protein n=1 Tax=Saccharomonospora saliphila TaxID=369829 RepID=UPI00039D5E1B|nr:hypothetical protein [Saccharomonospora saliphila]
MAVRLDVEPVKPSRTGRKVERKLPRRARRGFGLNFVRLSTRRDPGPLVLVEDPLTLRYLCRA